MTQIEHRIDLTISDFPLLTRDMGQSVLVSNIRSADTKEQPALPQLYYCHNVMPTKEGIKSVGYSEVIAAADPAVTTFDEPRTIFSTNRNRVYLATTTDGELYVVELGASSWTLLPTVSGIVGKQITIGTVNGISYILFDGVGCYAYNDSTNQLDSVTLIGLTISSILGVVASSGYLIAYDTNSVAWSSTIDPTDFTPSDITGAGGGSIQEIEGKITFCLANSTGFIIHTETNSVSAVYSGNASYPFKYRNIENSKGSATLEFAAYENNAGKHFVYSKAGMQEMDARRASVVLPELTDFLAGKVFEDFDEIANTFTETELSSPMLKKIKLIASRYLIISYGITEYTHALIYDIALSKMGKVKITHVDVFEYMDAQQETAKESIAFLLKNGQVKTLDFSTTSTNSNGVAILGKYQYVRRRMMTLSTVEVEDVEIIDTFSITNLSSIDGKTITATKAGFLLNSASGYREYGFESIGKNHSLVFSGKFNLSTAIVSFFVNGTS